MLCLLIATSVGIVGIKQTFQYSIMNACFGFVGVNVGIVLIRKVFGRRSILMLGATICGLCQLIPAIVWSVKPASKTSGNVLLAFLAIFYVAYNGCE